MKLELNKVYRARNGIELKIINIDNDFYNPILSRTKEENNTIRIHLPFSQGCESGWDLIELIGDDFTSIKEPRKFEFEGYIGESKLEKDVKKCGTDLVLDRLFLNDIITGIHDSKNSINEWPKISKWKFTMEEILE